jgi:peptide-methionine (R)-S-oxide reductase
MRRRTLLQSLVTLPALQLAAACARANDPDRPGAAPGGGIVELKKPKSEWKKLLEASRYDVLFEDATERPFTSPLNGEKRKGTFICAACFLPLFSAADKFDSGTGWPSFTQPIEGHMAKKRDFKLIFPRTEYHCIRCGGHQGHVFDDGPRPRGERWCNNGVALLFVADGEALPELRS